MDEAKICAPSETFLDKIIHLIIQIKTILIISSWVLQRTEIIPYQQWERQNNNLL